jgi:hypothetical protein
MLERDAMTNGGEAPCGGAWDHVRGRRQLWKDRHREDSNRLMRQPDNLDRLAEASRWSGVLVESPAVQIQSTSHHLGGQTWTGGVR